MGDIPYPMQVKLLRLLETGTYRRVGSTELRKTDFRLISATHQNMRRLVADGKFRRISISGSIPSPSSFQPCANAARIFPCSRTPCSPG